MGGLSYFSKLCFVSLLFNGLGFGDVLFFVLNKTDRDFDVLLEDFVSKTYLYLTKTMKVGWKWYVLGFQCFGQKKKNSFALEGWFCSAELFKYKNAQVISYIRSFWMQIQCNWI